MTAVVTESPSVGPAVMSYSSDFSYSLLNASAHLLLRRLGEALSEGAGEGPFFKIRKAVSEGFASGLEQAFRIEGEVGRESFVLAVSTIPQKNGSNQVERVLVSIFDETGRSLVEKNLTRERERLELALRGSNDGWWDWDLEKNELYYSDRWWEMLGYVPGELPADADLWRRLCHPDDLANTNAVIASAWERDGVTGQCEFRLKHKHGHYLTVSSRAFVYRDSKGRPVRLSGINQDVTDYRNTERALRESEQHRRQLFDSMSLGFSLHEVICDSAGNPIDYRFIEVNKAFERLTGIARERLVGKTVLEVLPGTESHWIENFGRVAITGETATFQNYSREFDRHYEVVCYCPKPGHFAVLSLDITERLRLKESVRRRDLHFMRLIENASDLITIVDLEGVIIYQSPSIERVLGFETSAVMGRKLQELIHPDDSEAVASGLSAATRSAPMPSRFGFRLRNRAGLWRDIAGVAKGIAEEHQVVINARDITEEHALASQLRQAQKMEAIGQLSGGIAHDFNNLLTAITGYGCLMEQGGHLNAEDSESIRQILEASERAAKLTNQLLAFSRLQKIARRSLDLNVVVESVARMLSRLLGETVRVDLNLAPSPLAVSADNGMLEQVLVNLAVNGRDAMQGNGTLTISTSSGSVDRNQALQMSGAREGTFAILSVADTGSGIPDEVLPKIFEPFFTTKGVGKGTGLGLPTVLGIVQQHEGWISVKSAVGMGTRFDLYFPFTTAPIVEDRKRSEHFVDRSEIQDGKGVLLVVEDDPAVRQFLRNCLRKLGYTALLAADSAEALELWRKHSKRICLLLTDVVMPGALDGWALARRILDESPTLPVVYSSGYSATADGRPIDPPLGASMLRKPYAMDELADALRCALQGARK